MSDLHVDQKLIDAAIANLKKSIAEDYDGRYGYLGADWDKEIQELYDAGERLGIVVYFEDLIMSQAWFFKPGEWAPDTYLAVVAERAVKFGLEDDRIKDPLPIYIERC